MVVARFRLREAYAISLGAQFVHRFRYSIHNGCCILHNINHLILLPIAQRTLFNLQQPWVWASRGLSAVVGWLPVHRPRMRKKRRTGKGSSVGRNAAASRSSHRAPRQNTVCNPTRATVWLAELEAPFGSSTPLTCAFAPLFARW